MYKVMIINVGSHFGGAEKHIYDFLRHSNQGQYEFHLVIRKNNRLYQKLKNNKSLKFCFLEEDKVNFKSIRSIYTYIKRNKINLIHAHTTASNLIGSLLAIATKTPIVTTIHGIVENDYNNYFKRNLYLSIEKNLLFINKSYICVSNFVKSILESKGYKSSRLKVIYNGVETTQTSHKELIDLKEELNISGKKIVGTIGRLESVKNIELLINIMEHVQKIECNITCLIIGEGSQKEFLIEKARKMGILENILFLGYQENPYKYMELMDVYVHTSRMETFGLTVVEAAKLKIPVVCNSVGALPEIATSFNGNIITIPNEDINLFTNHIKKLLEKNSITDVPDVFEWDKCIDETYKIYSSVLKEG